MRLTLVVSDCPPVGAGADPLEAPPLPALSTLLRAADREALAGDWRRALIARFAPVSLHACAPAVIASAALPDFRGRHACFATPVHLLPTPGHLRMPADALLRLEDDEGRQLAADFGHVFDDAELALHFASGRFLLAGLPVGEGAPDPAELLGSRLAAPAGIDPASRRLASEIELWLHQHEVNRARGARGRPTVDALWLWGGGALPDAWPRPPPAAGVEFVGDDAFLAGLAALAGSTLRPMPAAAPDALHGVERDRVVQIAVSPAARPGGRSLAEVDADIVAPALDRLRAGELDAIDMLFDRMSARLTRRSLARFWRRRRPWWEYLRR